MDVFLTHLAVEGKVSASMQNQALATLLFLYRARLGIDLPGHKDVSTTMIYTHVLNRGGRGVVSPLDGLS
jgi:site-specific recombinase XerD